MTGRSAVAHEVDTPGFVINYRANPIERTPRFEVETVKSLKQESCQLKHLKTVSQVKAPTMAALPVKMKPAKLKKTGT